MGRAWATAAAWWPPSPRRPPYPPNLSPNFLSRPPTAGQSAAPIGVDHVWLDPRPGPLPARVTAGGSTRPPPGDGPAALWPIPGAQGRNSGPQGGVQHAEGPPHRHGAPRRGRGVRRRQLARGAYCGYAGCSPQPTSSRDAFALLREKWRRCAPQAAAAAAAAGSRRQPPGPPRLLPDILGRHLLWDQPPSQSTQVTCWMDPSWTHPRGVAAGGSP